MVVRRLVLLSSGHFGLDLFDFLHHTHLVSVCGLLKLVSIGQYTRLIDIVDDGVVVVPVLGLGPWLWLYWQKRL